MEDTPEIKYYYSNCLFGAIKIRIKYLFSSKLIRLGWNYYRPIQKAAPNRHKKLYHPIVGHYFVIFVTKKNHNVIYYDFFPQKPNKVSRKHIPFLFNGYDRMLRAEYYLNDLLVDLAIALKKIGYSDEDILNKIAKYDKIFGYSDGVTKRLLMGTYNDDDKDFFPDVYHRLEKAGLIKQH